MPDVERYESVRRGIEASLSELRTTALRVKLERDAAFAALGEVRRYADRLTSSTRVPVVAAGLVAADLRAILAPVQGMVDRA